MTAAPAPALPLAEILAASPALAEPLAGIERAAATDSPPVDHRRAGDRALRPSPAPSTGRARAAPVRWWSWIPARFPPASSRASCSAGWPAPSPAPTAPAPDGWGRPPAARSSSTTSRSCRSAAQPKLLRLVAERRYAPLGGVEATADVRFLAIGADDLPRRIESGAFRLDLYHRLSVFAFRLPPLRDRRDELPAIAARLLADLGERFGRPAPELAPEALAWMRDYPWPGNLTELRNVLERALILGPTEPRRGRPGRGGGSSGPLRLAPPRPAGMGGERPRPLAEVERQEIRRALAYTRGHQGRAAELLGLSRKGLWQKRKRHGIP